MHSSGLTLHKADGGDSTDGSGDGGGTLSSAAPLVLPRKEMHELLKQREHHELRHQRLVVQMCDATNELNEKEELLKLQEKEIEQLKLNAKTHSKLEDMGQKLAHKLQLMLVENQKLRKEKVKAAEMRRDIEQLRGENKQLALANVELCEKVARSDEDVRKVRRAQVGGTGTGTG